MSDIEIKQITIHCPGDESVGIFPATWTIDEEIYIDEEDLEPFRTKLKEAWEFVADGAQVYFATTDINF
mgnify:CR=1 FL=1